jgi:hypothetical protein
MSNKKAQCIEIFSSVYELNRRLSHDNKKETISKIRVLLEQADHSTLKEIDSRLRLHETHHRYIKQRKTWKEFAAMYCETQVSTPEELRETLEHQHLKFSPHGWFMLECQVLDSSKLGERTILPYGPDNTFKEPPTRPVSPRGLASDMATVCAIMPVEEFNEANKQNA